MPGRTVLALGVIALSIPAIAGCGGGGAGGSGSSGGSASSAPAAGGGSGRAAVASATVDIANFAYKPPALTVSTGGKVTWMNTDSTAHTATASDQKTFDTGTLDQSGSKPITFSKPGTYRYFCRFHPFMHGTVIVK